LSCLRCPAERFGPGRSSFDKISSPLLISAFERFQLLRQYESYAVLRRLGKPVEMLWLRRENAPHALRRPYHRYLSQQSAVDCSISG
jgi:hypothetical protein